MKEGENDIILYAFKIIKGIVPNPGISWVTSPRRGRLISAPNINNCSSTKGKTLKYHSFFCACARLFNCLPKDIRDTQVDMITIKTKVDTFLHNIPDQPRVVGYTMLSFDSSNSIVDQINYMLILLNVVYLSNLSFLLQCNVKFFVYS